MHVSKYNSKQIDFFNRLFMINLQDLLSFPSLFDKKDNSLIFPSNVSFSRSSTITLDDLRPILLNRTLMYPKDVYTEFVDVYFNKDYEKYNKYDLHFNIIVIPTGLLGIEYNKTHIFFQEKSKTKLCCLVEVIFGYATIVLQKIKPKDKYQIGTEVEEVVIIKAQKGDKIPIFSGYMYEFINTKNIPLILSKIFVDVKIDYSQIPREQGLAYYIIRKNARQEIVKNPRYRVIPRVILKKGVRDNTELKFNTGIPLYQQLVKNSRLFFNLLQ